MNEIEITYPANLEDKVLVPEEKLKNLERIFVKYVDVVVGNEGVTFLYEREWPVEDWKIIYELLEGNI